MRSGLGGVLLAASLAAAMPAMAQKSADTLRITWRDAVPTSRRTTTSFAPGSCSVIRPGIYWSTAIPETFQIKPLLAESFKWVDETTLEFTLRKNVTFHNGDKLTADDVVYTINTILTDKQVSTPSNYAYHRSRHQGRRHPRARRTEARVPRRARLHGDDALHHAEGVSREGRCRRNTRSIRSRAGPYKITKVNGVTEMDLERYDGYYADSPKGKPRDRQD